MNDSRRRERDDPLEKTGYRIPRSIVMQVREAVDAGEARSQNEFVQKALERELRVLRRRRLYAEYAAASDDPSFVNDLRESEEALDTTCSDGLESE